MPGMIHGLPAASTTVPARHAEAAGRPAIASRPATAPVVVVDASDAAGAAEAEDDALAPLPVYDFRGRVAPAAPSGDAPLGGRLDRVG